MWYVFISEQITSCMFECVMLQIYYDRSLQVPHKDKSVISSVCCQAESGHG